MKIYDFKVKDIFNNEISLSKYENKVLLIVNVASRCGNTHQYSQLQSLYEKYKDQGFEILGFPCNQFFRQEPNSESEILEFCQTRYNVSFDMFAKIDVNGKNAIPLYTFLKEQKPWTERKKNVQWNFEKFLIDRQGNIIERYSSKVEPLTFEQDIVKLL